MQGGGKKKKKFPPVDIHCQIKVYSDNCVEFSTAECWIVRVCNGNVGRSSSNYKLHRRRALTAPDKARHNTMSTEHKKACLSVILYTTNLIRPA
jgi:hypothetical protein